MCSSSEVYYSLVKKPRSTSVARRCITLKMIKEETDLDIVREVLDAAKDKLNK